MALVTNFVMPKSCSAFGCTNRSTKETRAKGYQVLPYTSENEKRRLCLKDIDPPADAWICSEHFGMLTTDLMEDLMTISTEPEEEETNYSSDEEGEIDGVIVRDTHRSLNIQIDLTLQDLRNMEFDNQKHIEEVYISLQGCHTGYPSKEQLQDNSKFLLFYTGL